MNRFLKNITSFLLDHTVWMYLTLFLFFSHLLHISMVKETWGNYMYYFFVIVALYFPVLSYAFFRKQIADKLPNWLNKILWFYCFMLHPALLHMFRKQYFEGLFPIDNYMHGTEDRMAFQASFHPTISVSVLATEMGIQLSSNLRAWFNSKKWSQRLGLDQLLFILIVFMSVFVGMATNLNMIERFEGQGTSNIFLIISRLLYYGIQVFLILMGYYGFYYVNRYYLIPQFLSKKGIVYYGFIVVLIILIAYPILSQIMLLFPFYQPISSDSPI